MSRITYEVDNIQNVIFCNVGAVDGITQRHLLLLKALAAQDGLLANLTGSSSGGSSHRLLGLSSSRLGSDSLLWFFSDGLIGLGGFGLLGWGSSCGLGSRSLGVLLGSILGGSGSLSVLLGGGSSLGVFLDWGGLGSGSLNFLGGFGSLLYIFSGSSWFGSFSLWFLNFALSSSWSSLCGLGLLGSGGFFTFVGLSL